MREQVTNNKKTVKETIKINQERVDVKCISLELKYEFVPPELECPGGTFIMNFVNAGIKYENLDDFIDKSILQFDQQIESFKQKEFCDVKLISWCLYINFDDAPKIPYSSF